MLIAKRFSVVRHSDHALPGPAGARPLTASASSGNPKPPPPLDVRAWRAATPSPGLPPGPALLVHAPRRTGNAVKRNRFKRRTRMALLKVLLENPMKDLSSWIIWVRPTKGNPLGCRVDFAAIEGQLRLALSRLG